MRQSKAFNTQRAADKTQFHHQGGHRPTLVQRLRYDEPRRRLYTKDHWCSPKGLPVRSYYEFLVVQYLETNNIDFQYEQLIDIPHHKGRRPKPDFTLPGWTYRLIIEVWGMDDLLSYRAKIKQRRGKLMRIPNYALIDVFPRHMENLTSYLETEIKNKRAGVIHL
jgi:hypothetical protein